MDFTKKSSVVEYGNVTIKRSQNSSDLALEINESKIHFNIRNIPKLLQEANESSGQNSDLTNALYILALGLQYTLATNVQEQENTRKQLYQASNQNVKKVIKEFRTAS